MSATENHNANEFISGTNLPNAAEDALRRSEANLSAIIENTTDMVYSLDRDFNFITFNQLFKNTTKVVYDFDIKAGISPVELLRKIDPETADKWEINYNKALNGETLQFVNEYPVENGKVYLSYSINPIWETGKVIGLSCFSRDITAQKLLEIEREKITADLLQRNKALEQFTYIISHNLRAPVANIIGLSSLTASMGIEDSDVAEIVESIARSANKLDEVISDLNQVLQVNKDINESVDLILLPALIENIKYSIKDLIEKDRVSIVYDFSENDRILSLKSFIHSILYNLILNSIKYRHRDNDPFINISTEAGNGKISICYRDNGRGIDIVKHGDELFGLYKRFDTSVEGKGMGLFMVKMQVESLGGTISVSSEIDKGTEFIMEFPQGTPEKLVV